jgi:transposase InsO family protein
VSLARLIAAQRVEHGIPHATSCRAVGVSQAWFYKWVHGDVSLRRVRRAALAAQIEYLFAVHHRSYGSPRITADLHAAGWRVSPNTVAALMAERGLVARPRRRRRSTTRRGCADASSRKAPDALRRDFTAETPDTKWCGDLTEIPTDEGRFYLAAVLDLHSRRCVGFAMDTHHDTRLARAALCTAIAVRGGSVAGVLFHTDQGGEYTGEHFAAACRTAHVTQSMGRTGSALDNAVAESFNSTLEFEVLRDHHFATREQARHSVAGWIDEYNTTRRHSTLGMLSPIDYEQAHRKHLTENPGHRLGGESVAQATGPPLGLKGRSAIAARRPAAAPDPEPPRPGGRHTTRAGTACPPTARDTLAAQHTRGIT